MSERKEHEILLFSVVVVVVIVAGGERRVNKQEGGGADVAKSEILLPTFALLSVADYFRFLTAQVESELGQSECQYDLSLKGGGGGRASVVVEEREREESVVVRSSIGR